MTNRILWRPSEKDLTASNMARFLNRIRDEYVPGLTSYDDLHQWSVENFALFWEAIWSYCDVVGERGDRLVVDEDRMLETRFFPDARLNFAENLLRDHDANEAIVFWGEDKAKHRMSRAELYDAVSKMSQALSATGVVAGDRVVAYMPNIPETIIGMLSATSIGAIWSSCSPDFGEQGVLDRFGQIEPTVLIACDGYFYNGKAIDNLPKLATIVDKLPSLDRVVVVPYLQRALNRTSSVDNVKNAVLFDDFSRDYRASTIDFQRLPFSHPLYILFSSGTTGVPKCIVHSAGGTLLQHLKEHQLHSDLKPGDRLFYFTTCAWMMWNWLVSGLASGATLLLYDGSPFYPDGNVLWDYADAEKMTHFGTSAKYIEALNNQEYRPKHTHTLSELRMMLSTGSPLAPESFDYVYEHVKPDVYLASISGGTDIVSCFVTGNPIGSVRRGEIACRGLGMAVEVWDENGNPILQQKGEMVCTRPFVSMPIYFWADENKDQYRSAYFDIYPNVWAQGDFAEITEDAGVIIYGRSDATLNPGGVRIGTAEIYRQVEHFPDVIQSLVIAQAWDNDVRVVLFLVLKDGMKLTAEKIDSIKVRIRKGASPRHVPAKVVQVADVPVTRSGKIAELLVRDIVAGKEIRNREALANPEALDLFRDMPELAS